MKLKKHGKLRYLAGTTRDLKSMRTRAELRLVVTRAKAKAWRLKMGGRRLNG